MYRVTPIKEITSDGVELKPGKEYYSFGVERELKTESKEYRVAIYDRESSKCHMFKEKYVKTYFKYLDQQSLNKDQRKEITDELLEKNPQNIID